MSTETSTTTEVPEIDAYIVTVRVVTEQGATNTIDLTDAILDAFGAVDHKHGILAIEPIHYAKTYLD